MKEVKIVITKEDVDEFNSLYFSSHPRAKKPRIKKPQHPSLNETMIGNNMKINQQKQNWKDFVGYVVEKNHLANIAIEHCDIVYVTYFADARTHDADNITPKFILDGLVASNLIVADDIEHVESLTIIGKRDKGNPRIEIVISVLD